MYFIIQALALCIHFFNKRGDSLEFLPGLLHLGVLLCLFSFQMKLSLADSGSSDIDLLHHGIETLGFSSCGGTGIEKFNDLILAVLHCLGALFNLRLNIGKALLLISLALLCLKKGCMELGFLLLLAL